MSPRFLIFASVLVAGCTALPPALRLKEAEVATPSTWSTASASSAAVDADWIKTFGDRQLSALVDEAIRNNHDIKLAGERLKQAAAQAKMANALAQPQLSLGMNGSRARRNFVGSSVSGPTAQAGQGAPAQGQSGGNAAGTQAGQATTNAAEPEVEEQIFSSTSNSFGPSLDISWELDVWGRIRAGQSASIAQMQAIEEEYRAAKTSLAAQVAKAYFALAEASEQRALAESTLKTLKETEAAVDERFRFGQAEGQLAGAQLRLAKSDTASAEAQVEQMTQAQDAARRQLETLLGRYPSGAIASPSLPKPPSKPATGLPSELLLRRPDLRAAERRYAASGARIKEAKLAAFPQFKLTANTGTSSEELKNILNSDFGVWTLAGNIVQPLFTGGRVMGEVNVRKSQERESLISLHKTALQAFSEVENSLAAEAMLAKREAALSRAARLAIEADDESRDAYRSGVGDILTVFNAQQRRLQASSAHLAVRRLRLDNRINLHLALGGDATLHQP